MCGRYYVDEETAKEIEKIVRGLDKRLNATPKFGEIRPTNNALIVQSDNGQNILSNMIWGFPKYKAKGVVINARSETALDKRMFSKITRNHRCLIPARGFYEWDKSKNKISFERSDGEIMLLAGIWNQYEQDNRFVIFTTEANDSMQNIHSRMPLIMEPNEVETWLHDDNSVEILLRKTPGELSITSGNIQQTLDL